MDTRKTVLISGCNPGGIGNSLCREFHSRGFRVFATARQTSSITDLADLGIETFALEVTDAESIERLKQDVTAKNGGKLDYLVNNAGRSYTVAALDVDFDEVKSTFDVNVVSVMRMCKAFAPLLIEAKGTIVQLGSLAGVTPYVFGSAYNASKAAVHAYSNTLRVELAPFGVRVVILVTGGVKSRIARIDRTLPEDSLYIPINDDYLRRTKHSQEVGMPADDYAKSVVGQLLRSPNKRSIWEGGKSWLAWFATYFLPASAVDWYIARTFNLWKLSGVNTKKLL